MLILLLMNPGHEHLLLLGEVSLLLLRRLWAQRFTSLIGLWRHPDWSCSSLQLLHVGGCFGRRHFCRSKAIRIFCFVEPAHGLLLTFDTECLKVRVDIFGRMNFLIHTNSM